MADIEFRFAWGHHDQRLIDDAHRFWREQDVMSPEDIEARVKQLCALAYANGKVVAVSTAHLIDFQRLRSRFAYYRSLVASEFRRQHLATRLGIYSRKMLANWSLENPEEKLMGLYLIFEADEFKDLRHVPVVTHFGMHIIMMGYTPDGQHIRIIWFDHATIE